MFEISYLLLCSQPEFFGNKFVLPRSRDTLNLVIDSSEQVLMVHKTDRLLVPEICNGHPPEVLKSDDLEKKIDSKKNEIICCSETMSSPRKYALSWFQAMFACKNGFSRNNIETHTLHGILEIKY